MKPLIRHQVRWGWLLLLVSSTVIVPTQWLLTTTATPNGIADLQLAGNRANFQAILSVWQNDPVHGDLTWAVYASLWSDFLFLAAYTLLFHALTIRLTARAGSPTDRFARLGHWTALGFLIAGASDALENVMLLLALGDPSSSWSPPAAAGFALTKFALLGWGLLYLALAGLRRLRK